jgi:Bacterial toxin of type II toxin-antitoxin system, YafQ
LNGYRDCHLYPDLVLICRRTEDFLHLVRLGSHSELFGLQDAVGARTGLHVLSSAHTRGGECQGSFTSKSFIDTSDVKHIAMLPEQHITIWIPSNKSWPTN